MEERSEPEEEVKKIRMTKVGMLHKQSGSPPRASPKQLVHRPPSSVSYLRSDHPNTNA